MTTPAIRWRVVSGFPDLVDLYSLNSQRYPHLLESVAQGNTQSQFDILFAFPGKTLELDAAGLTAIDGRSVPGTFLDNLSSLWSQSVQVQSTECPLPFYGGWFVYLGYELVRQIEPSVSSIPASRIGPVAMAQRFKAAVIRSHQSRQTYVVWEPGHDDLAEAIIDDLDGIRHSNPDDELPDVIRFNEESPSIHEDRILRVLEFIGAGHTYQANLSRPWKIDFASGPSPEVIYRRLRTSNPAPFAVLSNISQRSEPSTSCWWILKGTIWAGCARPERFEWMTCYQSSPTGMCITWYREFPECFATRPPPWTFSGRYFPEERLPAARKSERLR